VLTQYSIEEFVAILAEHVPDRYRHVNSLYKYFGVDPLVDSLGQPMHWVGRLTPAAA
jgi:hypothetical protein